MEVVGTGAMSLPPEAPSPVDAVRSTLIGSSLLALGELGWGPAYFERLPPQYHDKVRSLGVGEWLPVDLAFAHYSAYDALDLSDEQVSAIAASAARRTYGVMLRTIGRVVRELGGLSSSLLAGEIPRLWARSFRGGLVVADPSGPRELRVRVRGLGDLGRSPYFRAAFTKHYEHGLAVFAKTVEVKTLANPNTDSFGVKLAWQ